MKHLRSHWSTPGVIRMMALLVLGFLPIIQAPTPAFAAGTITGTVFRDFNVDGIKGATETLGVAGVTVKAYDASNTLRGMATTAAAGTYSLAATATGPYRIEFTTLPTGYYPTAQTSTSASTVQFVADGNSNNINLGINYPADYSQANPLVAVPYWATGDPTVAAGTADDMNVWSAFPYSSSGTGAATYNVSSNPVAIGTLWGEAWQPATHKLYAAGVVRRHAGLGSLGLGGIYVFNFSSGGAPAVSTFVDLDAAPFNINFGSLGSNSARGLSSSATAVNADPTAFAAAGEQGIGDIDMTDDGNTLFVVNLYNRSLVQLAVANGTTPTSATETSILGLPGTPTCTLGQLRPWGLKFRAGKGYLGVVCDGSTAGATINNLNAYILSFNPYNLAGGFSQVLTWTFNYVKGYAINYPSPTTYQDDWYPWQDTYSNAAFNYDPRGGTSDIDVYRAQPIVSDIEFDATGAMIIGVLDRGGLQFGYKGVLPDGTGGGNIAYHSGGDILRACLNVTNSFVLESAGVCGGVSGGGANGQGPGGGEFYAGDNFQTDHLETSLGGLAQLVSDSKVMVSMFDPLAYNTGGVGRLSNATGASPASDRYQLYAGCNGTVCSGGSGRFGKAAGAGDVEILSDPAPIEIGNRVWNDANHNGIQDPGEAAIAGVVLGLYDSVGTLITTVTTDSSGTYIFSSATGTDVTGRNYGVNIQPNTSYTVAVLSSNFATGGALAGLSGTVANATGNLSNQEAGGATPDINDSDSTAVNVGTGTNVATIGQSFITGGLGANNHSFDFGFFAAGTIKLVKQTASGDGTFTFASADSSFNNLSITTSGGTGSSAIFTKAAGSYVVTENSQAGWNLIGLWCSGDTDGGSTLNQATRQATLDLDAGENLVCTFANGATTPPAGASSGVLTVTKTVNWNGSTPNPSQTFAINVTGPSYPSGHADTITAGTSKVYTGLASGVYTVTESTPLGWTTSYTATTGTGGSTNAVVTLPGTNTATLATMPITGKVYSDFNSNGVMDTTGVAPNLAVDVGVDGVIVTAYDKNGIAVGMAVSNASGNYTITPTAAGPYRVTFGNLPSGYEPTTHGSQNGTSTQFVTTAAGASNVNLGINKPGDYCQNNPTLCTSQFINGNPLAGGTANWANMLVAVPETGGNVTTSLATGAQIGATWGRAWQASTRNIYSSAAVRRHSGLGSAGLGGIYVTNLSGAPTTSTFVDLENAPFNLNFGNLSGNAQRGLFASATAVTTDALAFAAVGKQGMGDLDLSEDGNTLWAVNLNNRSLIKMNVTGGVAPTSAQEFLLSTMGAPTCTGGVLRPWGLKFANGKGYLGAVCSAETSGLQSDLSAYVLSFDPVAPTSLTTVLTFPLTYTKGAAFSTYSPNANKWQTWTDTYSDALMDGGIVYATNSRQGSRPTPILSDIEFDTSGAMILGFVDRYSLQVGSANARPNGGSGTIAAVSGGDILRACPNAAGSFVLEADGKCGGVTGGGANGQGPGTGEFYTGESFGTAHLETSDGGLAQLPGANRVALTAMDPTTSVGTGGIIWLSNLTGAKSQGSQIFSNQQPATMGKAVGLGDLEYLCDNAPLEIGNRAWNDLDGDGVQDPGEPGINGLTISLQGPTSTVTTVTSGDGNYYFNANPTTAYTVTTSVPTGYKLTTPNAAALSGASVSSNHAISDTIDSDAALVGGVPTIYYTTGTGGHNNHGLDFGFGQPITGQAGILNTAPPPISIGNHVWYDTNNDGVINAGESGVDGVRVELFLDANANGVVDLAEQTPLAVQNTSNGGFYLFTQTTNSSGVGTGIALAPGQYIVGIAPSNFASGGVLLGSRSSGSTISAAGVVGDSTVASATDTNVDNADDGVSQTSGFYSGGVLSGALVVTIGGEPASEPTFGQTAGTTPGHFNTVNGTAGGTAIADANSNLTVDFGFYRQTLGNLVFTDLANNGVYDAGTDSAIVGATVKLFASNGTTEILVGPDGILGTADDAAGGVTTGAAGTYLFQGLPQGSYRVQVTPPGAYLSSTDVTSSAAPDNNIDNDDNGVGAATGAAMSAAVTLTPGSAGAANANTVTAASGTTANPTVDFGFSQPIVSVGNRVWFDTNNNSLLSSGEVGADGVRVELFLDANNDGVLTGAEQTPIAVQITTSSGYYLFTQTTDASGIGTGTPLLAGNYLVGVPAANFAIGGPLSGSRSSGSTISAAGVISDFTVATNTNTNVDNTDDGVSQTSGFYSGGLLSGVLVVTAGAEPGGTTPGHFNTVDGTASGTPIPNLNVNRTVDFGVYRQTLGNLVWNDLNNNGVFDAATEAPLAGATVKLFTADGTTELPVGPDGILGTADDAPGGVTTGAAGTYLFQGLPQGSYRVQVTPPSGYVSSTDITSSANPNNNINNDDNGVGSSPGAVMSAVVTLTPGSTGVTGANTVTNASGTTANPTVDFGFYQPLSLGNLVWNDLNNNGLKDASESGIDGVKVNLYIDTDGDGTLSAGDTLVTSQNTSNGGHYLFTGLAAATYLVQLDPINFQGGLLDGYISSSGVQGTSTGPYEPVAALGTADNDDNGSVDGGFPNIVSSGVASGPIVLAAGTQPTTETDLGTPTGVTDPASNANSNLTIDFGVWQPTRLGDYVWFDTNRDGVQ